MWGHLNRQGVTVARCTVERLMRAHGWRGVTRARKIRTTVPDPAHTRAPDLVNRNFTAGRPGQLHVADFSYVPVDGGGFGYTAFCVDAFAGLIAGWECSLSKQTAFVQKAIGQAAALRARQGRPLGGRAIHHSDAGSQYTSVRFAETLMLAGLAASVGSVGDACVGLVTAAGDDALLERTSDRVRFHDVPPGPRASPPPWPPGRARNAAKTLAPKYQASRSRPAQKTAVEMLYRPLMREHRVAPPAGPAPGIGPSHTGDVHAPWTYDHV